MLKNSKFLKREIQQPGGDVEALGSAEEVLFKDYLKQQIDHLMTGDAGRDGVAEGRRGTHVEVPTSVKPSLRRARKKFELQFVLWASNYNPGQNY